MKVGCYKCDQRIQFYAEIFSRNPQTLRFLYEMDSSLIQKPHKHIVSRQGVLKAAVKPQRHNQMNQTCFSLHPRGNDW